MSGTVSSRTPEGAPNRCPVCDTDLCIEPSQPPGDAPCPSCGTLLWFSRTPEGIRLHRAEAVALVRNRAIEIIRANLGLGPQPIDLAASFIEDIGADSLDIVELVMELEDEFSITVPEEDVAQMKTVRDAIDYLVRRRP
jgi:acyl carrier protein